MGSGPAWLAHQLTEVKHRGSYAFGSVIAVTGRVTLDSQLKDTIRSFMQVDSTVVHADRSGDLRKAIVASRKIVHHNCPGVPLRTIMINPATAPPDLRGSAT
jgi:type I site-specific restriction-modification system R (restriction) subunit